MCETIHLFGVELLGELGVIMSWLGCESFFVEVIVFPDIYLAIQNYSFRYQFSVFLFANTLTSALES